MPKKKKARVRRQAKRQQRADMQFFEEPIKDHRIGTKKEKRK